MAGKGEGEVGDRIDGVGGDGEGGVLVREQRLIRDIVRRNSNVELYPSSPSSSDNNPLPLDYYDY